MRTTDVFATPCWNFVGGDRGIEAILRGLPPGSGLVVRNRLANVLATAAGLADIGGFRVRVPRNAVYEPLLDLDLACPPGAFLPTLLSRLYGVTTLAAATALPDDVVVALGYDGGHEAEAAQLADWLRANAGARLVIGCETELAPSLRPFAVDAWSVQRWRGTSAFGAPGIEEAVAEARPARVLVAAAQAVVAAHTAIGAVDWGLRAGAALDVSVLAFASRPRVEVAGTWFEAVLRHLEDDLGVVSTAPEPGVKATREAVAIDLA